MVKNPITDTHLGIDNNADRFSEVRQKAKDEYIWRKTRKDKAIKVPKYKIGEKAVLTNAHYKQTNQYLLVEVIDFSLSKYTTEYYYGIILKSSVKNYERIGRLMDFRVGSGWAFNWYPANVPEESIKWER